ncbi:MAG: tetratricopeptide repeat protein [Myxococcales bacterium]
MPVVPVVYTPPVYSLSFAYVGRHHGVVVSSVRYVEPVVFAPPAMVVYPTVYAAPVVTPVVYSPIVAAPVVAPVAVPVVTPVYAPLYYYYPAYAYYPTYAAVAAPAYVVEPAPVPVVAAPAVVEAPSSGWSIGTAFSFAGHHGHNFGFGFNFTKVKSEPAVVAAPAVVAPAAVAPAVAVEPAPAVAGEVTTAGEAPAPASLEGGLAAIRADEMEKARNILSQVVLSDPDNGMARMLYAAALVADGQYKEAAEALRRSLETWPDFQLKDFYLPAVYDNPKTFTKTMRDVREFLSDHPERTDAWLLVAWSYAVSGQSNEANMLLTEAKKSWPEDGVFATLDKAVQASDAADQATASTK